MHGVQERSACRSSRASDHQTHPPCSSQSLTQTIELSEETDNGDGDDPFHGADVYDECDISLAIQVVSDHLLSGGSLAANFVVGSVEGGITRCGDAEAPDAEQEEP
jgi:hypothetical protein